MEGDHSLAPDDQAAQGRGGVWVQHDQVHTSSLWRQRMQRRAVVGMPGLNSGGRRAGREAVWLACRA